MKRKILLCFTLVVLTAFFGGCKTNNSSSELKNRIIVQGIGIDKKDGELSVSVQALNTDVSSNSASSGAPEEVVKYYSLTGKSVSEAINSLSDITGKDPLISQNRIVVFGRSFLEEGITDYLDDFVRTTENRITVYVAAADDKAQDIIFASLGENIIPARRAEEIISSSDFNSNVINTRVYDLLNAFSSETDSAVLPVLKCEKNGEYDVIEVSSTAIVNREKLVGEKGSEIATGILWVNGRMSHGEICFECENGMTVTAKIIKNKTDVGVDIENTIPCFNIKINCSLDLNEINKNVFEIMDLNDIEEIGEYARKSITQCVQNSIDECINKDSSDVFGFGRRLKRTYPDYFRDNVFSWEESMKKARYNIQVNVKIERVGGSVAKIYK